MPDFRLARVPPREGGVLFGRCAPSRGRKNSVGIGNEKQGNRNTVQNVSCPFDHFSPEILVFGNNSKGSGCNSPDLGVHVI